PFALEEMRAVANGDLDRFDRAFFGHLRFALTTAARAFLLAITNGRLDRRAPAGLLRPPTQQLSRLAPRFRVIPEAAMVTLGGELKRREAITGRFADALAWLYLGSAVAKRFHDAGEPAREKPFAKWAIEHALVEIERALAGVLRNLPSRFAARLISVL